MRPLAIVVAGLVLAAGAGAQITTLDFEAIPIGTDLPGVNAVSAPLGATFDAAFPHTFVIAAGGAGRVVRSQTFPDAADVLVTFDQPRNFVRATIINAGAPVVISAYGVTGTPGSIIGETPLAGASGVGPATLQIRVEGIVSLQLEAGAGEVFIDEIAFGSVCQADCDLSEALDFFDFLCFQNAFSAEDPYADCDSSGGLDFFDFLCFQNAFAAGCP